MVKVEKNIEGINKVVFIDKVDLKIYLAKGWKVVNATKPAEKEVFQRKGRKRPVSEESGE